MSQSLELTCEAMRHGPSAQDADELPSGRALRTSDASEFAAPDSPRTIKRGSHATEKYGQRFVRTNTKIWVES